MAGRAGFILYLMRLRLVGTIILLICFPYWWRTHSSYCSRTSCFNRIGAPAHTAKQAQEWLAANTTDFIAKDEWPPNSPDLNPLDYCVWGLMLAAYQKHSPNPTTKAALKVVLQTIWDNLLQDSIDKAVMGFRKRLRACVTADCACDCAC